MRSRLGSCGPFGFPAAFGACSEAASDFFLGLSFFSFLLTAFPLSRYLPRYQSMAFPHLLQTRIRRPSESTWLPSRVCFLQLEHMIATLEIWIDASRSTIPP